MPVTSTYMEGKFYLSQKTKLQRSINIISELPFTGKLIQDTVYKEPNSL
jgi:hypothetical protein